MHDGPIGRLARMHQPATLAPWHPGEFTLFRVPAFQAGLMGGPEPRRIDEPCKVKSNSRTVAISNKASSVANFEDLVLPKAAGCLELDHITR